MHVQDLEAKDDLVLIDELRSQELSDLDGSRHAILLALPAKPRACKPSRGVGRKRASRDPAEHRPQCRVELAGMNPSRHTEHVRDVFRPSACGLEL